MILATHKFPAFNGERQIGLISNLNKVCICMISSSKSYGIGQKKSCSVGKEQVKCYDQPYQLGNSTKILPLNIQIFILYLLIDLLKELNVNCRQTVDEIRKGNK